MTCRLCGKSSAHIDIEYLNGPDHIECVLRASKEQ